MTATPDTVTVPTGEYRELRRLALIGQAAETAAPTPGHRLSPSVPSSPASSSGTSASSSAAPVPC